MILYHASPDQNLKYLDPNKQQSGVDGSRVKEVYATDDKSYAAGFCFNWDSSRGFTFGKNSDNDPWELKVPPKYANWLRKPCSIYTVETKGFRNLNISTPEYASRIKVKILSEEKYPTGLECLRQNGVKVSILKRVPFMDNSLIRSFKKLIEKKISMDGALVQNFKIDDSDIHGKGVIATKEIEPGERINVALFKGKEKGYHTTRFGAHINHSSKPNARTKKEEDQYVTYSEKKINPDDEITVDYTVNPELEQPDPSWG
jgi:hypothetical protein